MCELRPKRQGPFDRAATIEYPVQSAESDRGNVPPSVRVAEGIETKRMSGQATSLRSLNGLVDPAAVPVLLSKRVFFLNGAGAVFG